MVEVNFVGQIKLSFGACIKFYFKKKKKKKEKISSKIVSNRHDVINLG